MNNREHEGADARLWIANAAIIIGGLFAARAFLRARRAFDLRDRVVLITGGSRGLGLELARVFAWKGARLALAARDAAELARAERELAGWLGGTGVLTVPCDVGDRTEVEALVETVSEELGAPDVLVNNAGVIQVGPADAMEIGDYEEALRAHFWGPLYAMLAVLPAMRSRGSGRIVNISSIGGKISVPHLLPYCASKFALTGLSEGMRATLAREGVYVTTVIPGLMRTGSPRNAYFKGRHRSEYAWFSVGDALPGLSMSAARAARAIVAACEQGDAELTLPVWAKLSVALNGLVPNVAAEVMALMDRALPAPGGIGSARAQGAESESAVSPSLLTALGDRAATRNNEMNGGAR
jgi:NAD(P)-dependent dehydrogenase (short-subunit alcohol dehydrogenase family)